MRDTPEASTDLRDAGAAGPHPADRPVQQLALAAHLAGVRSHLHQRSVILIKPVIVIILGLGAAILSGSGTGGGASLFQPDAFLAAVIEDGYDGMFELMGTLIVGLVTLFIAAMSPTMVMSLVEPPEGGGAMAAGSPGRAGGKTMQYGYYGSMFRRRGGNKAAAARTGSAIPRAR